MNRLKIKTTLLAAVVLLSGCTDPSVPPSELEASDFTRTHQNMVKDTLPLDDPTDFDRATKGLIASDDSLIINNANGEPIWNMDQYRFLQGQAPYTVNPSLWRQAKLNAIHGLFEVAPGLYQLRGYDLANMTVIKGERGWIIVDPLTTAETAARAMKMVNQQLGKRPVTAVIFTHSHADHFGGVDGVLAGQDRDGVEVIAPAGFMKEATSENLLAGPAMVRRAGYQYGKDLTASAKGHVDLGLGKSLAMGSVGIEVPTREVDDTGEVVEVDGVTLEFQMVSGSEAPAEFTFYLPQWKAFCGAELVSQTMHNIYTLRGAKVRDALQWSRYIDEARLRFADAELYFGSHHWPVWGQQSVQEFLIKQRDLYKFIHDQTLRFANQGYSADEIAERVHLPDGLKQTFSARGYYGTLKHNIRGVYQYYYGWYDANPAHLDPLPRSTVARRYVELAGGAQAMREKAQVALDLGEYRWAAELLNHLVFFDASDQRSRQMLAQAYRQMGYQAESGPWRDVYLSGAQELIDGVKRDGPSMEKNMAEVLAKTPMVHFLDVWATRLDYEAAGDKHYQFVLGLTDKKEYYLLEVTNGVMTYRQIPESVPEGVPALVLTHSLFIDIATRRIELRSILGHDELEVSGDVVDIVSFFRLFDSPEPGFAIIEP
ncbi:alkyl/aryl-sulfatase [Ferrimonas kyonanensis]|uniref:alkyl/aryl-sulfatase n=1 Tax=Ferrimonas kyonanensis TaxID=364763 RepID=UPI001FE1A55D|nr:alkyl sulfatase dimerization domain-containing protein [Ferrimonas kyonanensis]